MTYTYKESFLLHLKKLYPSNEFSFVEHTLYVNHIKTNVKVQDSWDNHDQFPYAWGNSGMNDEVQKHLIVV